MKTTSTGLIVLLLAFFTAASVQALPRVSITSGAGLYDGYIGSESALFSEHRIPVVRRYVPAAVIIPSLGFSYVQTEEIYTAGGSAAVGLGMHLTRPGLRWYTTVGVLGGIQATMFFGEIYSFDPNARFPVLLQPLVNCGFKITPRFHAGIMATYKILFFEDFTERSVTVGPSVTLAF
jgi:hypothetical protein